MPQPIILLVSDLPTWGRVALASAIPIVEAAGFQACALPTALLSTHGAYPDFVLEQQSSFVERSWTHLDALNLSFAGALFGFVGDLGQFAQLAKMAQSVKAAGGLVLVDPILGDNGRRYGLFCDDYVPEFRALLAHADLATPNLTEAALLLGEDPLRTPGQGELNRWTRALADLGPGQVVITSAPFEGKPEATGVVWYDRETNRDGRVVHRRFASGIPGTNAGIPGTGDALAARLLSLRLKRVPFPAAVARSVRSTLNDLKRSLAVHRPPLWGAEGPLRL